MKAIICVGISASGKTTFAKELCKDNTWVNINRDDLRFSITGAKGWADYKFSKANEKIVTEAEIALFNSARAQGKNVIISNTNLNPSIREGWVDRLKTGGYEIEQRPFPISLEEAWKRDAHRENGVGKDVIYQQWKKWNEYIGRKIYEPDTSLPSAVIFDVDGTLAHMHNRKPYDWDKVKSDHCREMIRIMLLGYHNQGYKIIIVSGRDGVCWVDTQDWLKANSIPYYDMYMREKGDMRKDTVVKEEIFWQYIANEYDVRAVVDDRPCVIRLWHDIGIPNVISVGNPWEEF